MNTVKDVANDAQVAAGYSPDQSVDASQFTQDTLSSLKAAGVSDPDVTFTGHSLGAHLANALQDAYAATTSPNCLVTLRNSMTLSDLLTAPWGN